MHTSWNSYISAWNDSKPVWKLTVALRRIKITGAGNTICISGLALQSRFWVDFKVILIYSSEASVSELFTQTATYDEIASQWWKAEPILYYPGI